MLCFNMNKFFSTCIAKFMKLNVLEFCKFYIAVDEGVTKRTKRLVEIKE